MEANTMNAEQFDKWYSGIEGKFSNMDLIMAMAERGKKRTMGGCLGI